MPLDNREGYKVFIPENIDLDNLLQQSPCGVINGRDYILAILSLIRRNRYEIILATTLQYYSDNYRILINWLKNLSIIEVDEEYSYVKGIAKRYKYHFNYNTPFKEEFITKRTLIRKLIEQEQSSENNENVQEEIMENQADERISGYGYGAFWVPATEVAKRLRLKPRKMIQGLAQMVEILPTGEDERDYDESSTKLYYYNNIDYGRFSMVKMMIDENEINKIKFWAERFPDLFPRAK